MTEHPGAFHPNISDNLRGNVAIDLNGSRGIHLKFLQPNRTSSIWKSLTILNTSIRTYTCMHLYTHGYRTDTYGPIDSHVLIRSPFVYAVCQCAGLDSRGFNNRYRGDCCSLSACSTQPNDRISSHRARLLFVKRCVQQDLLHCDHSWYRQKVNVPRSGRSSPPPLSLSLSLCVCVRERERIIQEIKFK